MSEANCSLQIEALEATLADLRLAVFRAQMGSCSCLTKTPDPQYHAASCTYRRLSEVLSATTPPSTQAVRALRETWLKELATRVALDLDEPVFDDWDAGYQAGFIAALTRLQELATEVPTFPDQTEEATDAEG